ncbi:hypothetical protein MRX96_006282 [Rhipicephalus microplus]
MALTKLKAIPVTARQLADRRTSMRFLDGEDGNTADQNLLSELQSAVRVLLASREGRTVTLRFEGTVVRNHVTLFREHRRVATIMASSTTALSRRAVEAVVTEETREVRSYASAVKDHAAPARPTPAPRNLHRPNPSAMTNTPAVPAAPATHVSQPPVRVSTPAAATPKTQLAATSALTPVVEQLLGPPFWSPCRQSLLCFHQSTRFVRSACR